MCTAAMTTQRVCSQKECVIVWKCLMIWLILTISGHIPQVLASCGECTEETGLESVRKECSKEGQMLHDADDNGNKTVVCKALHDTLQCISSNVPQCLGNWSAMYIPMYENCTISEEQTVRYRETATSRCDELTVIGISDDDTTAQYAKQSNDNTTTNDHSGSSNIGINVIITLALAILPVCVIC